MSLVKLDDADKRAIAETNLAVCRACPSFGYAATPKLCAFPDTVKCHECRTCSAGFVSLIYGRCPRGLFNYHNNINQLSKAQS